jgi:hypothetical protein
MRRIPTFFLLTFGLPVALVSGVYFGQLLLVVL